MKVEHEADATCDGKKKMYELLSHIKRVHLLGLPQTVDNEKAYEYWLCELYRLRALLEAELGNKITDESLNDAIKQYNRVRESKVRVFELNKGDIPLLTGSEASMAVDTVGFEVDLPGYIDRMNRVVLYAQERGGIKPRPRILLTGCPATSKKVLHIIEESAIVIAMENCGGLKTVDLVEEDGDSMAALARASLKIACPCMSPNHRRYELLAQLIKEYRVNGVVDLTWQACHTYNIESLPLSKFIRDELGVPFLQIETNYSDSDTSWIQVRVDAFVEML